MLSGLAGKPLRTFRLLCRVTPTVEELQVGWALSNAE